MALAMVVFVAALLTSSAALDDDIFVLGDGIGLISKQIISSSRLLVVWAGARAGTLSE